MSGKHEEIDVGYVAELARLELDNDEKQHFQLEMAAIVDYIELLQELDVEGIEPTAHATILTNVLRDDATTESFPRDNMLENAPATVDEELIKVPQVLPGEEMN